MTKVFCTFGLIVALTCASTLANAQATCSYFTNPSACLPAKANSITGTNTSASTITNTNSNLNQTLLPNTNYNSGTAASTNSNFGFTSNSNVNSSAYQNVTTTTNANGNSNNAAGANSNSGNDANAASNSNSGTNPSSGTTSLATLKATPAPIQSPVFNAPAVSPSNTVTSGRRTATLIEQSTTPAALITNSNITDNGILRSSQQSISANPNSLASIKSNSLSNQSHSGALVNSTGGLSTDATPKPRHVDDDQPGGKPNARPAPVSAASLRPSMNTASSGKEGKKPAAKEPKKKPTCIYLDNTEICGPS